MEKPPKNIFRQGAIDPIFIADSIAKHHTQKTIGAHSIFLGQVRNDLVDGYAVEAIEYTAYEEMALERMQAVREAIFSKYNLTCMHVHHSLGTVAAGEICLFVFTSSKHRKDAMEACSEVVELVKKELPVWGREIFHHGEHAWKRPNQSPLR